MTVAEQIDFSNCLGQIDTALDNAHYLIQELLDEYFNKLEPSDAGGRLAIAFEFPRYRAFARMLRDCLVQIRSVLPSSDWVDTLEVERNEQ